VAIAFVQAAGNKSDSATTLSTTIAAPTAGNQLVVVAQSDALNSAITLSALTSQAWTKIASASTNATADGSASQPDIAVWISTNCGTGTTVTMNNGSAVGCAMVVFEFSGTANLGSDDGNSNSGVSTSSVSTWTCASKTPATTGDVCVSFLGIDLGGSTVTNPSGYTRPTNGQQSTSNRVLTAGYKIKTDALAESPAWTRLAATTAGFAGMALIKAPAGGSTKSFTLATTGSSAPTFTLAGMLDAFTLASSGKSAPTFTLAGMLDAFTLASSGKSAPTFTLAGMLDAFTLASSGKSVPAFTLAGMLDTFTLASSGASTPTFGVSKAGTDVITVAAVGASAPAFTLAGMLDTFTVGASGLSAPTFIVTKTSAGGSFVNRQLVGVGI
jgi:hypothetical protein